MSTPERLNRENTIAMLAVQALLGLISPGIIAVAVHIAEAKVTLRFWVREPGTSISEDISDALFELEALFVGASPEVDSEVYIGPPPVDWPEWAGIMIYWAKD